MKNSSVLFFWSVLIALAIVSCRSAQQKEFIKEAKVLDNKMEELTAEFNNLPMDDVNQMVNQVNINIQYLNKHTELMESNTHDFLKLFGPYASSGKIMSRVIKKGLPLVKENLQYTNQQVDDLLYDLKKGTLQNPDSVQLYLTQEKNEVISLDSQIKELKNTIKQQINYYQSAKDTVEQLIKKSRKTEI